MKQKHSDIEDLFTADDYLGLYNEAFGKKHRVGDLPDHPDRLLLRLEALDGKSDHWRPAEVLLRDPSRVEKLSQTTLGNFEALASSRQRHPRDLSFGSAGRADIFTDRISPSLSRSW